MQTLYPHLVEDCKSTIWKLLHGPNPYTPPIKNVAGEVMSYEAIGARLKAVRLGLSDMSQREWAERNGFNPTQYNNWEKGARRIPVDAAERLCNRYGLTLDAIYRGRLEGLSENLRNVL